MNSKKIFLLCGFFFLAGCHKFQVTPSSSPSPKNDFSQGTGDGGGGGNGIDNKIYEAYIVDPLELPAYKKYIRPIFEKVKVQKPQDYSDIDYETFVTSKTWFIAPVQFKPLDKETLGLAFSDDQTQQLARQTQREIWIDSKYFLQMNEEQQAQLILHEIIMNIYFLKYRKMSEICQITQQWSKKSEFCGKDIDDVFLPIKEKPLIANDYNNIRAMTGWIWLNQLSLKRKDLLLQFLRNNFDHRIFEEFLETKDENEKPFGISPLDIAHSLERALILKKAPSLCDALNLNLQQDCHLSLKQPSFKKNGKEKVILEIGVQSGAQKDLFNAEVDLENKVSIIKTRDPFTNESFLIVPLTSILSSPLKKGDTVRWTFLVAKNDGSPTDALEIQALISIPNIITKVQQNGGFGICYGDRPQATNFSDDVIAITHSGVDTSFLRFFGNQIKITSVCALP